MPEKTSLSLQDLMNKANREKKSLFTAEDGNLKVADVPSVIQRILPHQFQSLTRNAPRGTKMGLSIVPGADALKINVTATYLECGGMGFDAVSLVADAAVSGPGGLDVAYSNMTGTTAFNNGTTITGTSTLFTTEYAVGDLIYLDVGGANAQIRRITVIASNTSLTVAAATTGGNLTGKAHQKRNWLALWFCCGTRGEAPVLYLSQSFTQPAAIALYSNFRRIGAVRYADTATNVEGFFRWIKREDWWWQDEPLAHTSTLPFLLVSNDATANTNWVTKTAFVPPTATAVKLTVSDGFGSSTPLGVALQVGGGNGVSTDRGRFACEVASGTLLHAQAEVPLSSTLTFQYAHTNAGTSIYIYQLAYLDPV